jgi:hypothetical protein
VRSEKSAGQSLVEFAIVVPVLLLIMLMAVDFGRVYMGWVSLTNVARIGANFAAQNPDAWEGGGDAAVQLRYRQLMARDAEGIDCTLPSTLPQPSFVDSSYDVGARVEVHLTCSFSLLTPLISNIIGDGAGNLSVGSSAVFTIRFGSPDGVPIGADIPTPSPSPTPAPTATPAPTPTPDPSAGPTPTPGPPLVVSFYGSPTSTDSYGGGPPGSTDENLIVGIPTLSITFHNTTTGTQGNCSWLFGDGGTSTACSATVSHDYVSRGTFTVSLTVDGQTVSRSSYVLVGCKVPAFAGVRVNSASAIWTGAGFSAGNFNALPGTGNYKIGYQSLAGGLINPPGGCSGATVDVGP